MFNTPTVTRHLLIINFICFLAMLVGRNYGVDLNGAFGLHFFLAPDFRLYQVVTYMFMHASWTHLLLNLLMLWMFARSVEPAWGSKRFLIFYMVCGVGAAISQEVVQYTEYLAMGLSHYPLDATISGAGFTLGDLLNRWNTVGASGSIYGVLLAFAMTFPEARILLLIPPIPLRAKYMVMICVVLELLSAFGTSSDGVAHFAHLGGMLFGYLLIRKWRKDERRRAGQGNYWSWTEYKPAEKSRKEKFKEWWQKVKKTAKEEATDDMDSPIDDEERERREQREIDRILDKIKNSGYESLTDEEKRKIFDAGSKK